MIIPLQPHQWERAKATWAPKLGLAMIGEIGEAEKNNIRVAWLYLAPVLTIEVKKKPWYIPAWKIEETIRESLEASEWAHL